MKKLCITLFLCSTALASCNASKVTLLGRLGLIGIFRNAHRSAAVAVNQKGTATPQKQLYVNKSVALRELFPAQPSPHSAVVRNGLGAVWASLVTFRNSFRRPYTDPQLARDLANLPRELATQNRALEQRISFLGILLGGASSAA